MLTCLYVIILSPYSLLDLNALYGPPPESLINYKNELENEIFAQVIIFSYREAVRAINSRLRSYKFRTGYSLIFPSIPSGTVLFTT